MWHVQIFLLTYDKATELHHSILASVKKWQERSWYTHLVVKLQIEFLSFLLPGESFLVRPTSAPFRCTKHGLRNAWQVVGGTGCIECISCKELLVTGTLTLRHRSHLHVYTTITTNNVTFTVRWQLCDKKVWHVTLRSYTHESFPVTYAQKLLTIMANSSNKMPTNTKKWRTTTKNISWLYQHWLYQIPTLRKRE